MQNETALKAICLLTEVAKPVFEIGPDSSSGVCPDTFFSFPKEHAITDEDVYWTNHRNCTSTGYDAPVFDYIDHAGIIALDNNGECFTDKEDDGKLIIDLNGLILGGLKLQKPPLSSYTYNMPEQGDKGMVIDLESLNYDDTLADSKFNYIDAKNFNRDIYTVGLCPYVVFVCKVQIQGCCLKSKSSNTLVQQIVNKEFNFAPFFLSTALSFFAVARAMPVKLALYKEKNEAKYTTHYFQIAALVICGLNFSHALYLNFPEQKPDFMGRLYLEGNY